MIDLDKLNEILESEDGKKSLETFLQKLSLEKATRSRQLIKFHERGNFVEFIEKVILKYNSKEYEDRWYSRSIMPPEDLYWFLYDYAKVYGRECNYEEWDKYTNSFSSDLLFCNGYYFNKMDGQGSVFKISKQS